MRGRKCYSAGLGGGNFARCTSAFLWRALLSVSGTPLVYCTECLAEKLAQLLPDPRACIGRAAFLASNMQKFEVNETV